jgi:hypothetical protein
MAATPVSGAATPAVLPFGTTLHHAGGSNSASCLLTHPPRIHVPAPPLHAVDISGLIPSYLASGTPPTRPSLTAG